MPSAVSSPAPYPAGRHSARSRAWCSARLSASNGSGSTTAPTRRWRGFSPQWIQRTLRSALLAQPQNPLLLRARLDRLGRLCLVGHAALHFAKHRRVIRPAAAQLGQREFDLAPFRVALRLQLVEIRAQRAREFGESMDGHAEVVV